MALHLSLLSLLVPDYDAGIRYYCDVLGFDLIEDTDQGGGKRWVRVAPNGGGPNFLLARAVGDQTTAIGRQGGGRVWLFLETDDFETDHADMVKRGVTFLEPPRVEPYGTVAVFQDAFGNKWDLIEYAKSA